MEFLPWKTVDLDGAFRVTAPESIAEEVIQELSNAVTFRFSHEMECVRLEILLTPPWGWEECFPASEQKKPPARFICRLISRSTGRRSEARHACATADAPWVLAAQKSRLTQKKAGDISTRSKPADGGDERA